MLIRLLAAGTRLPGWVGKATTNTRPAWGGGAPRARRDSVTPRGRNADIPRARAEEGRRMLAAIDPGCTSLRST